MHLLLLTFHIYAQPQLIVNDTHIVNDETTDSDSEVDRTDDEKNESNNPPEIVVEDEKLPVDINNTESIPIPNGTQDVSLILSRTAGVVRQNMGAIGDFSAVRVRGSSFRQVEIFVDGIALNPEGSSVVNMADIPADAFSQLDVYKASRPNELQSSAMGGVVNLIPKKGNGMNVTYSGGSFGTHRIQQRIMLDAESVKLLSFSSFFTSQGDFLYFDDNQTSYNTNDDKFETRSNNQKHQFHHLSLYEYRTDNLHVKNLFHIRAKQRGLAGLVGAPTQFSSLYEQSIMAAPTVVFRSKEEQLSSLQMYFISFSNQVHDPKGEIGIGNYSQKYAQFNSGLSYFYSIVPQSGKLKINLAGQIRGEYAFLPELNQILQQRWFTKQTGSVMYNPLEKLTTTIQMRAIQSPTTKGQNFLTGSVSLFASEIQRFFFLNSSINSYVRIPDLLELYGNQGNYIGNQDLQPEEGIQGEISLKYVPPKRNLIDFSYGVTSFWNPSQNRIVWVQNSQNTMRTVNIGDTWVQGFEAFINLSLFDLLQSNTQMTYNHSVNLTEDILVANNEIPRIPKWQLSQSMDIKLPLDLHMTYDYQFISNNYWDEANWFGSTNRSIHNLYVQKDWARVHWKIEVYNLLNSMVQIVPRNGPDVSDDEMITQAMSDFNGYPIAGRSIYTTLSFDF